MVNRFLLLVFAMMLTATTIQAQPQKGERHEGDLKAGSAAPDFTLHVLDGKHPVTLSQLNRKPTVLLFGSCT